MQGLSYFRQSITKEKNRDAARLWREKALALDPPSAALNGGHAELWVHCLNVRFGWWDDRETAVGKTRSLRRARDSRSIRTTPTPTLRSRLSFDVSRSLRRRRSPGAKGRRPCARLRRYRQPRQLCAARPNARKRPWSLEKSPLRSIQTTRRCISASSATPIAWPAGSTRNRSRPSRVRTRAVRGFQLVDLVLAHSENAQADKAKDAAQRLMAARRDFTIASWLKTQFRHDRARLEADVAALRAAGLPMG